jgi:hypothetical protein
MSNFSQESMNEKKKWRKVREEGREEKDKRKGEERGENKGGKGGDKIVINHRVSALPTCMR